MTFSQQKLRKIEDEIWRVVPNSNNRYFVSNYGRLKSFAFNKKDGKILNCEEINGFKLVQLNINKVKIKYYVHKLVAELWISKPSETHIYVTHLDGNKKNNQITNLEWHTKESLIVKHKENRLNDIFKKHSRVNNSKLNEKDVALLKSMLEKGYVQARIAEMFCISKMQVSRIKKGENWSKVEPKSYTLE